jgi:hypothetical protein
MDVIGDFKMLYLIITFKQDIHELPPCSFFFPLTFQSISTSPLYAFSYGNGSGGSNISSSNISFRLHKPVRLWLSPAACLPSPPPRYRYRTPAVKAVTAVYRAVPSGKKNPDRNHLSDLCRLTCIPTIDKKICV